MLDAVGWYKDQTATLQGLCEDCKSLASAIPCSKTVGTNKSIAPCCVSIKVDVCRKR
jgi:hypothetical protein